MDVLSLILSFILVHTAAMGLRHHDGQFPQDQIADGQIASLLHFLVLACQDYSWICLSISASLAPSQFYLISFTSNLSSWDLSSVTDMNSMLNGVSTFKQDLCAWGNKFPYNSAFFIFSGTSCADEGDPQSVQKGPFCASSC